MLQLYLAAFGAVVAANIIVVLMVEARPHLLLAPVGLAMRTMRGPNPNAIKRFG
jgi:hypothetical protein